MNVITDYVQSVNNQTKTTLHALIMILSAGYLIKLWTQAQDQREQKEARASKSAKEMDDMALMLAFDNGTLL